MGFDSRWIVKEHVIPASHIRGYPRGLIDEEGPGLRLAVKQYTPRNRQRPPASGDATIIFAHGTGSTKESYEPFIDELLAFFADGGIRDVWIPDIAWHGASYLLNEDILGDEPHWSDSSRDIIQLVNHFQAQMPPPIMGIGQSWGSYTLLHAAMSNPRLFSGVVAMEPTLAVGISGQVDKKTFAYGFMFKRDTWATRDEARAYLLKNPYYGAFDPEVFKRVVKYDLRDIVIDGKPAVTLTTPPAMEAYTALRPYPPFPDMPDNPDHRLVALEAEGKHSLKESRALGGFHRQEMESFMRQAPDLLPPVQIVWASRSYFSKIPGYRDKILGTLGVGKEGSGGYPEGKIVEALVEGSGHPLPLEKPAAAAAAVAPWLKDQLRHWKSESIRRKTQPKFWTKKVNPLWTDRASKL